VEHCPVRYFHTDGERIYIDPDVCIDCSACVPACPVQAISEVVDYSDDEGPWCINRGLPALAILGPIASATADGAYDGEPAYRAVAEHQPDPPVAVVIAPRSTAVPNSDAATMPSQRDQHIQMIGDKGRLGWQKAVGYGRRSYAGTVMFRYKPIIGSGLCTRTLPAQKTETRVACSVLNRITRLGTPVPQRLC